MMRYIPTNEYLSCSSDPTFCLGLFEGTISGNYWAAKYKNDYAEVYFNQSYALTSYTLYAQSVYPNVNAKGVLVQGILRDSTMLEIDRITSSTLTNSDAKQRRIINYNKPFFGVRFTVCDTWAQHSSFYSGILRIDIIIESSLCKIVQTCNHRTTVYKNWLLTFIAIVNY